MANWSDIAIELGATDYPDKVQTLTDRAEAILSEVEAARGGTPSLLQKMALKFELADTINKINELAVLKSGMLQNLDAKNFKIINLANPISATDAANKGWVTSYVQASIGASVDPSDLDVHALGIGGESSGRVVVTGEDSKVDSFDTLSYPISAPIINCDFANSGVISGLQSFSTASTYTYIDKYGNISIAGVSEPVVTYDASTLQAKGWYNSPALGGLATIELPVGLRTEGTVVVEFLDLVAGAVILHSAGQSLHAPVTGGGKMAMEYGTDSRSYSFNGGPIFTFGGISPLDGTVYILYDGVTQTTGIVKSIKFYAKRLTPDELKAVTI